jgi:glutaredoxin
MTSSSFLYLYLLDFGSFDHKQTGIQSQHIQVSTMMRQSCWRHFGGHQRLRQWQRVVEAVPPVWRPPKAAIKQGVVNPTSAGQRSLATLKESSNSLSYQTTSTAQESNNSVVHLYQYAICPFCNSVKALLSYANAPYQATEVNPLTKSEIQAFKKDYSKVPIVTISSGSGSPGGSTSSLETTPLFGSDVILQALLKQPFVQQSLQERWQKGTAANSTSPMTLEDFGSESAQTQWRDFRDKLALVLYPNMCRTWSDSYEAFNYVHHLPTETTINKFGVVQAMLIQNLGSLVSVCVSVCGAVYHCFVAHLVAPVSCRLRSHKCSFCSSHILPLNLDYVFRQCILRHLG